MPSKKRSRVLKRRTVYSGRLFQVTIEDVREPGGARSRREVVRHQGSVVILCVDESRKTPRILLERQYRHASGRMMWELPAGKIDPGEKPLVAAKRELLEETGYRARRWEKLQYFFVSPGFLDESMTVYLARQLTAGPASPEDDERIECAMVPLPKVIRMIADGSILDAKTISPVLWYERQYGKKK
jgi:8-oxo-dGTP pyrophosphatase MutT (NUDIX family)